jgi:hypothetical protein
MTAFDIPHCVHDYLSWLGACLTDSDVRQVRDYLRSCKDTCNYRVKRATASHGGNVMIRDLLYLFSGSGWTCTYCGSGLSFDSGVVRPTLDHIIPISRGGLNNLHNLVPACHACGYAKGSKCHLNFCTDLDGFADRYALMWYRYEYFSSSKFVDDIEWFRLKWLSYSEYELSFL